MNIFSALYYSERRSAEVIRSFDAQCIYISAALTENFVWKTLHPTITSNYW